MGILALLLTIALGTAGTAPPLAARSAAELPEISHARPAESAFVATAAPRFEAPRLRPYISGNYFGARYFSSQQGRFMSPDPVFNLKPTIMDPQRWNRYAYVRNNPLAFIDPDGRDAELVIKFQGDYSASERRAITAKTSEYLKGLPIGSSVVRSSDEPSKRTWGQALRDQLPGHNGLFNITTDSLEKGMSRPGLVKMGDLEDMRESDPDRWATANADAILHEVLMHQAGAGDANDAITYGDWGDSAIGRAQAADPEFKKKSGTLFDHKQDRFGTPRQIRKLNDTEKKKLKDELGAIKREYVE